MNPKELAEELIEDLCSFDEFKIYWTLSLKCERDEFTKIVSDAFEVACAAAKFDGSPEAQAAFLERIERMTEEIKGEERRI